MRALVSTTTTSEIGSPPKLKCVIFCGTPLSVIRKSDSSKLCTISPFTSRTVTGVFTSTVRNLIAGAFWIVAPCSGVIGPSGACAAAQTAMDNRHSAATDPLSAILFTIS